MRSQFTTLIVVMSFFVITNYIFGLNYVIVDVITLGNNKTYKFR
jgi:hypothetical protein